MDWGISLKNRRERGGLFGLLARNYLLFTLVLLLLAGGVFALWNAWLLNVYQPADWPGLLGDHALSEGSYERLRHYLKGAGDAFAVYGADGRLVYATEENFDPHCPPEVLETVVPYGSSVETQAFEKLAEDGSRRFLVIRHSYGEGADGQEERVDAALLDGLSRCTQPWSVSGPAQAAGLAALTEPEHPARARQLIAVERSWLIDALRALGLRVFPSEVNYILFRAPGVDDLKERLLAHGVLIRSCANYVGLGSDYYRVAVRPHRENEGLIGAMKEVL